MLSRIQLLGSCLVIFALLLFAGAASAQGISASCEAAIDRAAGHYSKCLLSADAGYARHKNMSKLENRQTRCETRFDRRTARVISRLGAEECPSSDLVDSIGDRTVAYTEDVVTESGGSAAGSRLYVQTAEGGSFDGTTLTLAVVAAKTGWFTERPDRVSGQMETTEFVELFSDEGLYSFAADPPNADLSCEVAGEVVSRVLTIESPEFVEVGVDEWNLVYTAVPVPPDAEDVAIACEGTAYLFIDSDGSCQAPVHASFGGYYCGSCPNGTAPGTYCLCQPDQCG